MLLGDISYYAEHLIYIAYRSQKSGYAHGDCNITVDSYTIPKLWNYKPSPIAT